MTQICVRISCGPVGGKLCFMATSFIGYIPTLPGSPHETDHRYNRPADSTASRSTAIAPHGHISHQHNRNETPSPGGDQPWRKKTSPPTAAYSTNQDGQGVGYATINYSATMSTSGSLPRPAVMPPRPRMLFASTTTISLFTQSQSPQSRLNARPSDEAMPFTSGLPHVIDGPSNYQLSPIDPQRQFPHHHDPEIYKASTPAGPVRSTRQERRSAPYRDHEGPIASSSSHSFAIDAARPGHPGSHTSPPTQRSAHSTTLSGVLQTPIEFDVRFHQANCPSWRIGSTNYPHPKGDVEPLTQRHRKPAGGKKGKRKAGEGSSS
ncbi:uncharacterized protein BT62DRAFT_1041892 [Guyanagaster necrorhizus]|uniref:Uncharacterized protein n=1 Tax=Guyanagaster necrorhizus TaxID=856835 RepID=A0A9P8ANL5_9AGAR|nr:uncharacterized protein BT62DRAFT_1041892 [Guyanagaster necrorhizus MCA 3950]KAG7441979.1 hypothetical protein BT62DRAFT_1041892 [Guyanagaster necrorhizus MCA 3950]